MSVTGRTLNDVVTSYATLQDGDLMFVERGGVAGKSTFAQVRTEIYADQPKTGNGAEVVTAADAGTNGQVAAWDASGNLVSGGRMGMEFIVKKTASASATLDFTEFNAAFDSYVFLLQDLRPSATATLWVRTDGNAGASFDAGASDYTWGHTGIVHGGSTVVGATAATAAQVVLWNGVFGNGTGQDTSGELKLIHPGNASKRTRMTWQIQMTSNTPDFASVTGTGARLEEAVVNGVRFLYSTGNIASGSIVMYGLRNS